MNEELTYVLEENNKNDIARILNNETLCELHKEKGLELHIIRMEDSGSFGVFLNKEEGKFSEKEILVVERYLERVGRKVDVTGYERIGVILDKEGDIKPFCSIDILFPYNKTYKTQSYARMIGFSMLNEVKDFNSARPDKEIIYNYTY